LIKDYKMLVIDIDGTLVKEDRSISEEDREALDRVRASGMQVALCTGRPVQSCIDIINQLSLDGYHIFFDGAVISNPTRDEDICIRAISKDIVKQMIDYAHENNLELEFFTATDYYIERETWVSEARRKFFDIKPLLVDYNEVADELTFIRGMLVSKSHKQSNEAMEFDRRFQETLCLSWTMVPAFPDTDFIGIYASGVNKGRGVKFLASRMGISLDEIMAVGDHMNDIALLDVAGLAVAMGNAHDELKAIADHVTLDVKDNGLAAAINKFLL